MNVLYGLYEADEGEILLDGAGAAVRRARRRDGRRHRHGAPALHARAGVHRRRERHARARADPRSGGRLDLDAARAQVRRDRGPVRLPRRPDALVEDLPVGRAAARRDHQGALARRRRCSSSTSRRRCSRRRRPTSSWRSCASCATPGAAIVFITHKLREVREVADRITVMRRGTVVGEASPTASGRRAGRADGRPARRAHRREGRARPRTGIGPGGHRPGRHRPARDGRRRRRQLHRRGGEVLVIAGVQGNGQTELAEALLGLQRVQSGSIPLDGTRARRARPCAASSTPASGFVPEDRNTDGLVGEFTVAENLVLDRTNGPPFARGGVLQLGRAGRVRAVRGRRSSTSAPRASRPRSGGCPAATSRRSCSPASCRASCGCSSPPSRPAAWTSARSSSSTSGSSPRADAGVPVVVVSTELDEAVALGRPHPGDVPRHGRRHRPRGHARVTCWA